MRSPTEITETTEAAPAPAPGRYLRTETRGDLLVVTLDDPSGRANKTTDLFKREFEALLDRLEHGGGHAGLVFRSAKASFGVGGDIGEVTGHAARGEGASFVDSERIKALFRRLERLPIPSVAMIEGTAAGGGWELALACNARIVLDDPSLRFGLPEVGFGLVPGAGGMVRLPRMVGLRRAGALVAGAVMQSPREALAEGLVDAVAPTREALMAAAAERIAATGDPRRPWDRAGHAPTDRCAHAGPVAGPPGIQAPRKALAALAAIAEAPFDAASAIESRCFAECAISAEAQALIGLGFHDRNARRRGAEAFEAQLGRVGEILAEARDKERARVAGSGGDLADRSLMAQVAAALRLLATDSGLAAAAMNMGSVESGGFPGRTGGVLRHVEAMGTDAVVARLAAMETAHGDAFAQPFDAEGLARRLAAARSMDKQTGNQP